MVINKLVNCDMMKGKKSVAAKLVRDARELLKAKWGVSAFKTLCGAVGNVALKVGGVSYQVPIEVAADRRLGCYKVAC